jgi:amino acid adenylation domain-containing protein
MGRWWSEEELNECVASAGDPAVVSLLNPVVPVLIKIEEGDSILAFADKWLESVANTQRRGPFFADLLDRGGKGESPMVDPAALPIQWLQESVGADSTNASSWQIHRENGRWLASGISDMSHVGELAATLRKMIRDQPATSIAALPRLGPEAELLLRRWESGGSFETTPESFLALIFGKFVSDEGSTAIETADGQFWTYGRLGREVASLMARLRAMGVEQGHMVPIRLGRSPELVTAQLAVMGLGCAFVPISDEDPDLRVLDVLARTHARVAIGLPPQDSDTTTWIAPLSDHKDPGVVVLSNLDVSLEGSIACVFFTSGSTGRPKGVKITHVGLDAYVDDSVKYFGRVALQRSIWTSSVAFDSTLSEVMISLSIGGSIVIPRPESVWSVRGFVESLSLYKITFVGISTDLWSMWMRDAPHVVNPVPSTLRLVGVGGGVLATELVERWLSIADDSILLCNGYGPTETTVVCTHYDIGRESLSFPSTPIGFPNRGAMIRVLDDHGRRVPPGIEGEIVIGGLGVADGYLDDPEETEARFVQLTDEEGRWYRSGDIGSWTEAGELLFHGRADEQVKIHGYRVEPEGICRAIRSLPGVNDAEVIAFKTQASKELGAVVIRMAEGASSVDGDSGSDLRMLDQDWTVWLQNQLEDKLPRHAVPRRWLLVDEWPRTTTGKVDQVELVSRFDSLARSADSVELIDPRDGRSVLQAIRNVLARPNADPSESFFDLGGDSMAAMGLQLELESAVGRSLPLTLVYGSKTIAEIIEGVADQADGRIDVKIDGWQSVIMTPGGVDLVFMPGYWGRAQLRHVWTEVGAFASIHAIDLGVEDYRQIASEVPDEEAFKCLADKLAQLVIEHLPDRRPLMVGYSSGGWFAFETANAMRRRGVQTPRLLLIEPDIYVGGRWEFRLWHRLDRLLNRIVHGRLFGRSRKTTGNAQQDNSSDDQRGDVPEVVREIHEKLDRFLASYRPERGDAPIHLVVRDGLAWRYATWRRLARGPFQREEVQFADHLDFKRPGSETVLTELLRRVAASHAANGDNSSS